MAESYAQRRSTVRKALSQVKVSMNLTNGLLEKARREADRLMKRKTIITSESLEKLDQTWKSTVISANSVVSAMTRLWQVARSFM